MNDHDFVFSTLIAHHPDPATASRALQMAQADTLNRTVGEFEKRAALIPDPRVSKDAVLQFLRNRAAAEEKGSRKADATPKAPEARIERYIAALRSADKYALVGHRDDLIRFAEAVIAVANDETDPVYRDGYATGRMHAGADGFRFRDFTPVFTTSDGTDCPATELRCVLCGGLVQGVGPHTLLDLMALAAQHDCQTEGGGR